jgi:hypothetical protein
MLQFGKALAVSVVWDKNCAILKEDEWSEMILVDRNP